jgi:hypothetical protein
MVPGLSHQLLTTAEPQRLSHWITEGTQSSKFLLVITSAVVFGIGTHDLIFVLCRLLLISKWGLLFDERRHAYFAVVA